MTAARPLFVAPCALVAMAAATLLALDGAPPDPKQAAAAPVPAPTLAPREAKARDDLSDVAAQFKLLAPRVIEALDAKIEQRKNNSAPAVVPHARKPAATPKPAPTAAPTPEPTRPKAKTLMDLFRPKQK